MSRLKQLWAKLWCWRLGHDWGVKAFPGGWSYDSPRCKRCGRLSPWDQLS